MNPKDKHADWLKKPMPEDDYVFVCKKCGDEIGIKYEPPQKQLSKEETLALLDVAITLLKRFGDLTNENLEILKKATEK